MTGPDEIRIERGAPTDEELAALVGALLLAAPTAAPTAARGSAATRASLWVGSARPGYAHRDGRPARPGPHAWRASAQPR